MWRSLKNSRPYSGILVKTEYRPCGAGAPERQGWKSVGRISNTGIWSIKQNGDKTVDFNNPTHWDWISDK